MTVVTYQLAPGANGGSVNQGDGVLFDITAAITAGGGSFTVDDQVSPRLISALDASRIVVRAGTSNTGTATISTDTISPLQVHSGGATGMVPVRQSDGTYRAQTLTAAPTIGGAVGGASGGKVLVTDSSKNMQEGPAVAALGSGGGGALTPVTVNATTSPLSLATGQEALVDLSQGAVALNLQATTTDQVQYAWKIVKTLTLGALTAPLVAGTAITAIAAAVTQAIPSGSVLALSFGGTTLQATTSASVAAGASSIPVGSVTPVTAVPAGTPVLFALTVNASSGVTFIPSGNAVESPVPLLDDGKTYQFVKASSQLLPTAAFFSRQQEEARYVRVGVDGTVGGLGGHPLSSSVATLTGGPNGRVPFASQNFIDICSGWTDGTNTYAPVAPATNLTVSFTSGSTTATITSGSSPVQGAAALAAIISDYTSPGTTYTASGNTITLSAPAVATSSGATAWAGQDATASVQAAMNYFHSRNTDGTIEASLNGVILINGAQQSGTANSVSYSGQLLFPSRGLGPALSSQPINIRFRGVGPHAGFTYGGYVAPVGGTVLLGCTGNGGGAGAIFSAIPNYGSGTGARTSILPTFEDITVRNQTNPQATAHLDLGSCWGLLLRGSVSIDTLTCTSPSAGNHYGIKWPKNGNFAQMQQSGTLQIAGCMFATDVGEHLQSQYLFVQGCPNVIGHPGAAHHVKFQKICSQNMTNGLVPTGNEPMVIDIDSWDIGDGAPSAVFSDKNDYLYGTVGLVPTIYSASEVPGLGVASNGGRNLVVKTHTRPPSAWPKDTFTRVAALPLTYPYGPGVADKSGHVWQATNYGVTFPTGGGMQGTHNPITTCFKYTAGRASLSRVVRTVVTPGTSFAFWQIIGKALSSGNAIYILANSNGSIGITKFLSSGASFNALATSATGLLVAGTQATIETVISNPYSAAGAWTITVFVNGAQAVTATLGTGDTGGNSITQLQDTDPDYTQDGLYLNYDNTSLFSQFAVLPAT